MLKLTRKEGETIRIGKDCTVIVGEILQNRVELVFDAPRNVPIVRGELDLHSPLTNGCLLNPIETAPKDGRFILLFGPSGYMTTPLRCEIARWDPEYRPGSPWQTYSNDVFCICGGSEPTHWMELPELVNVNSNTGRDDHGSHQ